MPTGAGFAPAGTSGAGYGVPDKATVPNNALLPDVRTGLPQTGRNIDPVTKSYTYTADGRIQGVGTVRQLVQLALITIRGSAVIADLGQEFGQIQEKGPNYIQQVTAAANRALASLVRAKMVQVVSVVVRDLVSNPDAGTCELKWRDLTTNTFVTTPFFGP
jgi:hypothetical protein